MWDIHLGVNCTSRSAWVSEDYSDYHIMKEEEDESPVSLDGFKKPRGQERLFT